MQNNNTPVQDTRPGMGGFSSPISADSLNNKPSTAFTLPPANSSQTTNSPSVSNPSGTTIGAGGTATVTPPATNNNSTSTQDFIKNELLKNYGALSSKGDVTKQLQSDTNLAGKTTQATSDYNTYNQAKLDLQHKIDDIYKNNPGATKEGVASMVSDVQRTGNANLANLAVIAQSSQGLLSAAEKTINDKLDAQFKPIQDNIDFLTKFSSVNKNDLTDSESKALDAKIADQKTDKASVQAASTDVHKTLLGANAPASAYSELDKITEDFSSGKITAQEAQDKMYAAASPFAKNTAVTTEKVTNGDGSTSVVRIGNQGQILSTTNIGGGMSTFSGGGSLPTVQMTPDKGPDPQSQQDFLAKLPKDVATLVKGIADYSLNPNSSPQKQFKGASGLTQAQMLSLVKQYDPTYDEGSYANRNSLKNNFMSGKYSQNVTALNTAVGHLSDIPNSFGKLGNSGGLLTPTNFIKNNVGSLFGWGAPAAAGLNINASTGELASTFKSGGATDTEIGKLGSIGTNSSPNTVKSYVQEGLNLLGSRLNALTDTYQAGMGKPPASSFLSPTSMATLSNLKNQGFDVNVKGVYFTDPIAYSKAKPENATALTNVRTAHPELSPAQATQLAQYLQENGQI